MADHTKGVPVPTEGPQPIQKAVIHTETRVIRRLTIDEEHAIGPDETLIVLDKPIDLSDGYWKLDDKNKKVAATEQEVDDADVDDEKVAAKRTAKMLHIRELVADLADNGVTPEKLQLYFQAIK